MAKVEEGLSSKERGFGGFHLNPQAARKWLKKFVKRNGYFGNRYANILSLPFYIFFSVVLKVVRVEFFLISFPNAIGHQAIEIDGYLKDVAMGDRPTVKPIYLMPEVPIANDCLMRYWEEKILVIRQTWLAKILRPFLSFPYLVIGPADLAAVRKTESNYYGTLARWGTRPPLLRLSESHRARGRKCLEAMGVPAGSWFVCVHSREGGYSQYVEHVHSYRNSDIDSYVLAMEAVRERGGWCIRVGDPTMKKLSPIPGVIDYATSAFKSDWMDIYLCAECRFFLGNTSGLSAVSTVFGVPTAQANKVPPATTYPCGVHDIGIPKILKRKDGEAVSFREAFDSPVSSYWYSQQYVEDGFEVIDNTPEDIRDLAVEMMDSLEGPIHYSADDKVLQDCFRSLLRPCHQSYRAGSRIGRDFLRKYAHLVSGDGKQATKSDPPKPAA